MKTTVRVRIDAVLHEHARLEARATGVTFARFVESAIQQAVAKASVDRALKRCRFCGERTDVRGKYCTSCEEEQ